MKRYISALLMTLLLAGASSASDNLKDALKQQYKKHVFGLRTSFQKGDQEFDSAGKPLKDPNGPLWIRQGALLIKDVQLDQKTLRIQGRQWPMLRRKEKETINNHRASSPSGKI